MTVEQYNAMTVEEKAAMLDEIQKLFISYDGVPFTMDDANAYQSLMFGYDAATEYDCPTLFIHELTDHLDALHNGDMSRKKLLGFENTEQLIKAFAHFAEADNRVRQRLHQN